MKSGFKVWYFVLFEMKRNINLEHFKYWLPSPDVTAAFSWRKNESCERFGEYWEYPAEKYWNYFYSEMEYFDNESSSMKLYGCDSHDTASPAWQGGEDY